MMVFEFKLLSLSICVQELDTGLLCFDRVSLEYGTTYCDCKSGIRHIDRLSTRCETPKG